jgi:hypothetical protein
VIRIKVKDASDMNTKGSEGCGAGVPSIKNRIEMRSKSTVKGEMEQE